MKQLTKVNYLTLLVFCAYMNNFFVNFALFLRKIGRVIECARLEIWYTHYVVSGV